jgi:hypothetical protein
MIILLHTSKTMRVAASQTPLRQPALLRKTVELATYLKTLSPTQLTHVMHVSAPLAEKTHETLAEWNIKPSRQTPAIESFIGDIYSGLQANKLTTAQRNYADTHLYILSGLYGVLRSNDGVSPYRLEMGYRLLAEPYANLYKFWGDSIAKILPKNETIINLAAVEYSRVVLPFVDSERVITPKFLTYDAKTSEYTFVVVHAKIARGAFAHWLIISRVTTAEGLSQFAEIGYRYSKKLSTPQEPVFVCKEFGGKGLSVRLQKLTLG